MPEVPELNALGLTLQKHCKGHKVKSIEILWKKKVKASQQEFDDALIGAKLKKVQRNGKELHMVFENGHVMGIHMMLTGAMYLTPTEENIKYPIFELLFDNGKDIIVADGMGGAKPILDPEIPAVSDIEGKDFTADYLQSVLSKTALKVKDAIQSPKRIRGIGNAYADEILWHSKISPLSVSKNIPEKKVKELYGSIRDVTEAAIKQLSSMKDSESDFGMENKNHRLMHNANRTHAPDGEEIKKGKVGSSVTYYTDSQELF